MECLQNTGAPLGPSLIAERILKSWGWDLVALPPAPLLLAPAGEASQAQQGGGEDAAAVQQRWQAALKQHLRTKLARHVVAAQQRL